MRLSTDSDKPLEFQCPKCAKKLKAPAKAAGKRFNCPNCSASVKVPGAAPIVDQGDDWLKLDGDLAPPAAPAPKPAPTATVANSSKARSASSPAVSPSASNRSKANDSSTPTQPTASIFDDDLPQLAELEPPKPRTTMASLLGVDDIEQLVPVKSPAAAPPKQSSSTADPSQSNAGKTESRKSDNSKSDNSKKAAALDPANAQYRVPCPSCGTPQYVTTAKQGKMVRCPDCFLDFKIPPPPPGWKPTQAATKIWSTDLVQPSAAEAQRDNQHRSQQADDLLKKAAQELDDNDLDKMYDDEDFDTQSFMRRTFGFLRDTAAAFQVATYCVVFAILFALLQWCLNMAIEHRGFLLLAGIGVPALMLIVAFPMFGAAISILESVANGQSKVRDWHGFNFFDQIGEMTLFTTASLGSAIPGFIIGGMLAQSTDNAIIVVLTTMITSFLAFPIILLSMLDNESAINPFSPDVLRSISVGTESWGTYYFKTFIANFIIFVVLSVLLSGQPANPILAGVGGLLMPLLFFFTIQQLGVLAHDISEHLAIIVPPKEDDDKEIIED